MLLRAGFAVSGALDADESEHLHAAWLVGEGRIPYRDFWENHSPLLYYALAPLTRAFTDSPQVYVAARLAMSMPALAAGAFLYLVGQRLGPATGLVSVLLLAFQPGVIRYTTQVRPDEAALALWLAMLVALIRWRESRAPAWIWTTGLLLGVMATLTPKAVYSLVGVTALVVAVDGRGPHPISGATRSLLRLGLGAAIPLVLLLATLWVTGGVNAPRRFLQFVVIDNLRFPDPNRRLPLGSEGLILVVLAIGGLVQSVRRLGASIFDHPVHGPLLVPAAVMLGLLVWPRTPAVYEYTWLPIVMAGSVYAALAVETVSARAAGGRATAVVALMIVLAFLLPAGLATAAAVHNKNHAQLGRMQLELAHACPGDAVFDGTGLYVFRPNATRYPALVIGIRHWIEAGKIDRGELVADLRRARPPVGLWDRRLGSVGGSLTTFAERYYVRRPDGLLLAGAAVSTEREPAHRSTIDLLRTMVYDVSVPPGGVVEIDGRQVFPGPVKLLEGSHVVTWSGTTHGQIEITGSMCAERGAAAGASG